MYLKESVKQCKVYNSKSNILFSANITPNFVQKGKPIVPNQIYSFYTIGINIKPSLVWKQIRLSFTLFIDSRFLCQIHHFHFSDYKYVQIVTTKSNLWPKDQSYFCCLWISYSHQNHIFILPGSPESNKCIPCLPCDCRFASYFWLSSSEGIGM